MASNNVAMLWIPGSSVAKDYPPYIYAMGSTTARDNSICGAWSWPIG